MQAARLNRPLDPLLLASMVRALLQSDLDAVAKSGKNVRSYASDAIMGFIKKVIQKHNKSAQLDSMKIKGKAEYRTRFLASDATYPAFHKIRQDTFVQCYFDMKVSINRVHNLVRTGPFSIASRVFKGRTRPRF
jgi:hypothetical protein